MDTTEGITQRDGAATLAGREVIVAVCGGIAYNVADIVSKLVQRRAHLRRAAGDRRAGGDAGAVSVPGCADDLHHAAGGARPLVEREDGWTDLEVVIQEVLQDKTTIDYEAIGLAEPGA